MYRTGCVEKLCGSRLTREPPRPRRGQTRFFVGWPAASRPRSVLSACAPCGGRARDPLPTAPRPALQSAARLAAPPRCVASCTPRPVAWRGHSGCTGEHRARGAALARLTRPAAPLPRPRSTLRVVFGMGEFRARSMCSPSRTGLQGRDLCPGTGRACRAPRARGSACAEHWNAHPCAPRITVWARCAAVNSAEPVDRAGVIDPRNRVALTHLAFGPGPLPDRA